MEDILRLYKRPLNRHEPVVCIDEKPTQLLDDVQPPRRRNGAVRRDYEYRRKGTRNIFCMVEPKAGKHFEKVTKRRGKRDFALFMQAVAKRYKKAKVIHCVMDNLSTHTERALQETFGARRGPKLWKRFKVHYTPKHGSWLNQAEIEICMLTKECLGKRRLGTGHELRRQVYAWMRKANREERKIQWTFTVRKARKKFSYKRP
jgi:hypothetical protein